MPQSSAPAGQQPRHLSASYAPLQHAPWHGWTPTDLIFPFFLFIVGITTQLSTAARRRTVQAIESALGRS